MPSDWDDNSRRGAVTVQISIVISTYNRAESLKKALSSLGPQVSPFSDEVELVVVDNNSSDNTGDVVSEFATTVPIRYVRESQQGLSFARNRGVSESNGATVLFTDDDIRFGGGWFAAYVDALETYPEAGFFGGRILPDWIDCSRPTWLKNERLPLLSGILGCYDLGERTRLYEAGEETPFGASFAVRRAVFSELGGFRGDLGVRGRNRGRGEDTEFFGRTLAAGVPGVYVGAALCWHRVEAQRLTLEGLFRHGMAKGRSHRAIRGDTTRGSVFRATGILIRGLRQLLLGRGDRLRQCVINAGMEIGKKRPDGVS